MNRRSLLASALAGAMLGIGRLGFAPKQPRDDFPVSRKYLGPPVLVDRDDFEAHVRIPFETRSLFIRIPVNQDLL